MDRRCDREPPSHLTGEREFWSLPFRVSAAVLDPRPDSETLVEAALQKFADSEAQFSVLDLGTGSGCLLLSVLKHRPMANGVGVDLSSDALEIAAWNAARLGLSQRVRFIRADWGAGLGSTFDLILCNPPYIATGDLEKLEPEVKRFEPRDALDGGGDGLDAYRKLFPQFADLLQSDGVALVEIGAGQTTGVTEIANKFGLQISHVYRDLAGIDRCLAVTLETAFTVT